MEAEFAPDLSPQEMLKLGVFGGAYFLPEAFPAEYPKEWATKAKLSHGAPNPKLNFFGVLASQPLMVWQQKGWIHPADPLGWFQWYCRYTMGRRISEEDTRQIKRWRAMKRHVAQIERNCAKGDLGCRRKQRQALLQWGYDSRII